MVAPALVVIARVMVLRRVPGSVCRNRCGPVHVESPGYAGGYREKYYHRYGNLHCFTLLFGESQERSDDLLALPEGQVGVALRAQNIFQSLIEHAAGIFHLGFT